MKVVAIIPAAGLGTRMTSALAHAGQKPASTKQFVELDGTPILIHSLRKLANSGHVHEIFIAAREEEMAHVRELVDAEACRIPVHTVAGGEHRQESVANALAAVQAEAGDAILVHDAVRPFVDADTIRAVIEAVAQYGAAIAGVPAVDTVKNVDRTAAGAVITSTVPRERVVLAQTPQGFRYSVIKQAFDEARADGFVGTDEASVVERSGYEVWVVMGSPRNLKITTPADLELAEFYLSQDARRNLAG